MSKAEYQCPVCGWTMLLPVNSKQPCPSCLDEVDETHIMRKLDETPKGNK